MAINQTATYLDDIDRRACWCMANAGKQFHVADIAEHDNIAAKIWSKMESTGKDVLTSLYLTKEHWLPCVTKIRSSHQGKVVY